MTEPTALTQGNSTRQNPTKIRLGTRGSALARWQTDHVQALLSSAHGELQSSVHIITTKGDQVLDTPLPLIGGKGLFTLELENSLRSGSIDIAVHSLKDLPTESPTGLTIGAIPARANPADVLVSRDNLTLDQLPTGAIIGTSSRRRAAQILRYRPDIQIRDIRGNVDTRVRKVLGDEGLYHATILAYAGLQRLGLVDVVSQVLPFEIMLPAPGQGALGVQCRDEPSSINLLASIHQSTSAAAVVAERAFLAGLGGGCSTPVAAYATFEKGALSLSARVLTPDGSRQIELSGCASLDDAESLGYAISQQALDKGANELINEDKSSN